MPEFKKCSSFAVCLLVSVSLLVPFGAFASDTGEDGQINSPRWTESGSDGGIWKAVTPPGTMKGEFESHDPIGLAAGALIKADCSINWVNPDNGKLFCFSSGTSLVYFLNWPGRHSKRAQEGWQKLTTPSN